MKQHVNLYELRFRRERPPVAAALLAKALGVATGLLLLAALHGEWRVRGAGDRVDALRAQRAAESTRIVELASLYPAREADPALQAATQRLALERDAKTRLLGLLSNQSLGNTRGFSRHVEGIARRHVHGLWLRELQIEAGGGHLALAGSTLDAELVPRFLRALGEEDAFAGRAFRSLRLERAEEPGRIDWSVRTREQGTEP